MLLSSTSSSSGEASTATTTTSAAPAPPQGADQQEAWAGARRALREGLGGDGQDDEVLEAWLKKGFGWQGQAFWRGSKVGRAPGASGPHAPVHGAPP